MSKKRVNMPLAFVKVSPTPMAPREKMVPKKLAPKIVTKAKASKHKGASGTHHQSRRRKHPRATIVGKKDTSKLGAMKDLMLTT